MLLEVLEVALEVLEVLLELLCLFLLVFISFPWFSQSVFLSAVSLDSGVTVMKVKRVNSWRFAI